MTEGEEQMARIHLECGKIIGERDRLKKSLNDARDTIDKLDVQYESIVQGSNDSNGCQAISEVYFRKGANWVMDKIIKQLSE